LAGLDPAIHVFFVQVPPIKDVDARLKPGEGIEMPD
jgi:hypothetical protein